MKKKILLLIISCLISIVFMELILRVVFYQTSYFLHPALKKVQNHLTTDDLLGFLWKPEISYDDKVIMYWADHDPDLKILSTDKNGFKNHPLAIEKITKSSAVDIVGIGDSFVHDAAYPFYNFFNENSLSYYNLAMHRHSLPQYNLIMKLFAFKLKPKWIVYGYYENDLKETFDFLEWNQSGIDWFTYHSGYWCGPPIEKSMFLYYIQKYFKGFYICYKNIFSGKPSLIREDNKNLSLKVILNFIKDAHQSCISKNINFLFLMIPSKDSIINGKDIYKREHTKIENYLKSQNINYLNLKDLFLTHKNKSDLYYKQDGHWNINGMNYAASIIQKKINELELKINR